MSVFMLSYPRVDYSMTFPFHFVSCCINCNDFFDDRVFFLRCVKEPIENCIGKYFTKLHKS